MGKEKDGIAQAVLLLSLNNRGVLAQNTYPLSQGERRLW
jgi:hypothetical protein